MPRQKVTPFLWFDSQALEAAEFYVTLFPDSAVTKVTRNPDGKPFVVEFRLAGVGYTALNGGSHFTLTPAFSLSVDCRDQAEVDDLWAKLLVGGEAMQCGWLTDRFGVSWQVVPEALPRLFGDPDRAKAARVQAAMMGMVKLDVAALEAAAASSE